MNFGCLSFCMMYIVPFHFTGCSKYLVSFKNLEYEGNIGASTMVRLIKFRVIHSVWGVRYRDTRFGKLQAYTYIRYLIIRSANGKYFRELNLRISASRLITFYNNRSKSPGENPSFQLFVSGPHCKQHPFSRNDLVSPLLFGTTSDGALLASKSFRLRWTPVSEYSVIYVLLNLSSTRYK